MKYWITTSQGSGITTYSWWGGKRLLVRVAVPHGHDLVYTFPFPIEVNGDKGEKRITGVEVRDREAAFEVWVDD